MAQERPDAVDQDAMTAANDGATRAKKGDRPAGRIGRGLRELLIVVVGALIISSLLRAFVAQMFVIPSGSMENTLLINDRIVVSKVSNYHRGSIIVFKDTENWLETQPATVNPVHRFGELVGVLPDTSSNHLVKRLIGLPGDHVVAKNGVVSVNGKALDESSYVYSASGKASDFDFDVTVPAGHVFVMGDHRDESGDSRCHLQDVANDGSPKGADAFVPTSSIEGPVVAVALPIGRAKTTPIPSDFNDIPAGGTAPAEAKVSVTNPTC